VYRYRAYSLGIHSDIPLPELMASAAAPRKVVVRLDRVDSSPPEDGSLESWFRMTPEGSLLFWRRLGAFLVRRGKEIIVDPLPEVDERLIRLPLLGTVFAVLLHQRRLLVLHGSAVSVDGGAAVFLGNKGWGKSTTAAALYSRGHHLVADDLIALEVDREGCNVLPGFPVFKLWPDAAASSLGEDPERLPLLASGYEKRARRITDRFVSSPVPVRCVYVLSTGAAPEIRHLKPQQAARHLIEHSYVARFGDQLLRDSAATRHLSQCANVSARVPICGLERPNSLMGLNALAQLVEDHIGRVSG
jgi:hypothetical protein